MSVMVVYDPTEDELFLSNDGFRFKDEFGELLLCYWYNYDPFKIKYFRAYVIGEL